MKTWFVPVLMLFYMALLSPATAAKFAPLFTIKNVDGNVTVQTPGSDKAIPVETGKAYPYGSTFRTESGASVDISLSEGNSVSINGNSVVVINQDSSDSNNKVLHIHSGKVDFDLENGFEAANGFEILTRYCSIVALTGGSSSVDAKSEGDLKVTVVKVIKGELEASGPSYDIPLLNDNNAITISCSDDRSFIRLRDLNGNYGIEVDDEDGMKRLVEMEKDSVIKILRKRSDVDSNVIIVTILEINSDGDIVTASTFSVTDDDSDRFAGFKPTPPPSSPGEEPKVGAPPSITIVTTTSSSSTSTTSTTATGVDATPRPRPQPRPPVTPPGEE
jgi:hypothetical protein